MALQVFSLRGQQHLTIDEGILLPRCDVHDQEQGRLVPAFRVLALVRGLGVCGGGLVRSTEVVGLVRLKVKGPATKLSTRLLNLNTAGW